MRIDILTLFPKMYEGPLGESIIKRAQNSGLVEIGIHDIRDYSIDKHKQVDDRPYGGGAGMVMKVDVIDRALQSIKLTVDKQLTSTVLLSAKGTLYTQKKAQNFSRLQNLILIAGHYEGVDERVAEHLVDEEIRVGNYVLTGGELPSMIIADSVIRLLPGVLGNKESAVYESHSEVGYLEHPHYTRPEEYNGWKVPEVLLNGNHAEIEKWRKNKSTSKQ